MKTKILKVKITFLEPVLGTWPSNQNVARDFIASKSPDAATIEDEVAALGADAVADKGMTVFPRNESGKLSAYKKVIDGLIFPQPRMIPIKVQRQDRRLPAPPACPDGPG